MATVILTTTYECAGGDHLKIAVTGDATDTLSVYVPDLSGNPTEEERQICLQVLLRLARKTRTKAQLKAALQLGLLVTI